MTTLAKVLLTGIAVFLIAIAAFMLIGTNSGRPLAQPSLNKPVPTPRRQLPARGWQILPIRSASILRKAAKP